MVSAAGDGVRVRLRVSPGASRNAATGCKERPDGPALAVCVTAPPEGGKANKAVIAWAAKEWKVAKSSIEVTAGASARDKVLFVSGNPDVLGTRIKEWVERLNG